MTEPSPSISIEQEQSGFRSNWKHLRIPYQLTLAPIFLWGYFLAAPAADWRLAPAFLSLHLLLYPGITAYNSYYDRDVGPIGGLRIPPRVQSSLCRLAWALKTAGFGLAGLIGWEFTAIYAVFVVLSVLYSHPQFRWKANPYRSLGVVGLGQGGLGYLAGWVTGRPHQIDWLILFLGLLSASLTVAGMYPLTQLFQVAEDSARGDYTLCVVLGRRGAVTFSISLLAAGGIAAAALIGMRNQVLDALLIAVGYASLLAACIRLRRDVDSRSDGDLFRHVTALNYAAAAGFGAFILLRIARWS